MRRTSLLVIFLTVFIDLIGFGIVLPLLPLYSERFGAKGIAIGLIISSFSLMQFLFAPAWGRLSDRIGRRPVLLVSNLGSAISYAMFAYASTLQGNTGLIWLIASRVFAGISGANLSVASAYIADVSPPEKRSKSMGLIGMAFGLGFIFGPALGGLSSAKYGYAAPGIIAASLCTANFILGFFILGESLKPGAAQQAVRQGRLALMAETLKRPEVGFLVMTYFLSTFCFTVFEATLGLLLNRNLGYDQSHAGYVFAYCGIMAALIQGGAIGRLVKALGERKLIATSLLVTAVSLAILPFCHSLAPLLVGLAIFAAGSGMNRPPTFGLISILTPPEQQGATLGITQSAGSLGRIFGPPIATTLFYVQPSLPYIVCGVVACLASAAAFKKLCGGSPAKAATA